MIKDRHILIIDTIHPVFKELLEGNNFVLSDGTKWTEEECLQRISVYNGIAIRSRFRISRKWINQAVNLHFIARAGAGMENIEVEYAGSKGISCIHAPEGNRDAVGEHAIGMLLSLMNHLNRADSEVRMGIWKREENRGLELKGKTIGVIGFGNMGSAFTQKLAGFESRVLVYDKYKEVEAGAYYRPATMEEIFKDADILSLHVPLTDETRYMIDDSYISRFKKNIFLLNTSRGQQLNTADLVNHLKTGKVAGAALDVLEYESVSFENLDASSFPEPFRYLIASDRVILSPHIAGWTQESNSKIATVLAQKIIAFYKQNLNL